MKNICRPFTLYSDFLPPGKKARECGYLSFGYFDGVNVGNNLFVNGQWSFEKLWDYTGEQKQKLNGSYSEQTIFGFRCDEDEDTRESEFWKDEKNEEFPFFFLCALRRGGS